MRVVVVGASGFVGRAVVRDLETRGHMPVPLELPFFGPTATAQANAVIEQMQLPDEVLAVLRRAAVVINAAGNPGAVSANQAELNGANAVLPGVLANACADVGVSRLVHVSTAAVQGRVPVLDSSYVYASQSPYATSKMLGELALRNSRYSKFVIYRPPGVHARGRSTTDLIAKFGASRFSTVPRGVDAPTPQATLESVASAITYLAVTDSTPPEVVHHPSEGLTTRSILSGLGGKEPSEIPAFLARAAVNVLNLCGKYSRRLAGHARRLEVLWYGQEQARSWLEEEWFDQRQCEQSWTQVMTGGMR